MFLSALREYLDNFINDFSIYIGRELRQKNGVSQPFERLAQLVGSLVSISKVRGSSLALSTTKNLSHTIYDSQHYPFSPQRFRQHLVGNRFLN